ncbi:MAG: hypothetical protein HZB55_02610 [Deltaproteobacteria bacterium]|nr:hypothetical protein [Deltaproteobacteria bacterium]
MTRVEFRIEACRPRVRLEDYPLLAFSLSEDSRARIGALLGDTRETHALMDTAEHIIHWHENIRYKDDRDGPRTVLLERAEAIRRAADRLLKVARKAPDRVWMMMSSASVRLDPVPSTTDWENAASDRHNVLNTLAAMVKLAARVPKAFPSPGRGDRGTQRKWILLDLMREFERYFPGRKISASPRSYFARFVVLVWEAAHFIEWSDPPDLEGRAESLKSMVREVMKERSTLEERSIEKFGGP